MREVEYVFHGLTYTNLAGLLWDFFPSQTLFRVSQRALIRMVCRGHQVDVRIWTCRTWYTLNLYPVRLSPVRD